MYWVDYHIHSENSFDGRDSVRLLAESALSKGFREIAVTDHFETVADEALFTRYNGKLCREKIREARALFEGKLKICFGVEIGQPQCNPPMADEVIRENAFDFVIGSVHNLKNDRDLYYIDYAKEDCAALMTEYIGELFELLKWEDFDVLGHLNYPARYMFSKGEKRLNMSRYEEPLRELFKNTARKGKGIEINTSGLRQPLGETLPPLSMVRLFRECGGEILTVGSDAHSAADVGSGIKTAMDIARAAGFRAITVFEERRPSFIDL